MILMTICAILATSAICAVYIAVILEIHRIKDETELEEINKLNK